MKIDAIRDLLDSKFQRDGESGHDVNYLCPFCQASHLHVNYDKGGWGVALCHGCDYRTRDLRRLVRDAFGYMPKNIQRLLDRSVLAIDVEKLLKEEVEAADEPVPLPDSFRRIPYRKQRGPGSLIRSYIINRRGFTYDDIDRFGVGYIEDPEHEAYGYAIFPFWVNGRCVYWQGRRVFGHGPKSYNPPSSTKKSLLYGYDQAVSRKLGFIAEGPFDVWAWGAGGLGLTGVTLHPAQLRALCLMRFEKIIVCLDADAWGRTSTHKGAKYPLPIKVAMQLYGHVSSEVGVLRLKSSEKDPAQIKGRLKSVAKKRTKWWGSASDVVARATYLLQEV